MRTRHAEVVILGGGFAGKAVADTLCDSLAKYGTANVRVVLVDKRNYQLFTPMLYQAATGLVDPAHIAQPIRQDVKKRKFEFIKGRVDAINLAHKLVVTNVGGLSYDYLVIALGSVADDERIPGAKGSCVPLKTADDSEAIHNRILASFEVAANLPKDDAQRKRFLTFVVIGGSTGSELAGSLRDYLTLLCEYYPSIDSHECKVVIVERRDRLFPSGDESLSLAVKKALEERGVELRLNVKVTCIKPPNIEMADGTSIEAENLFWDAGTRPSPILDGLSETVVPKHRGRILVDEYLRIPVFDNVYVVGDDAAVKQLHPSSEQSPRIVAPTAEAALEEGKYTGRQIAAIISGRKKDHLRPFVFKEKGVMLSLGHRYGIVKFKHVTLKGFIGWMTWRAVHVALLSNQSSRFGVLFDWTRGTFRERDISEVGEVPMAMSSEWRRADEDADDEAMNEGEKASHGKASPKQ